MEPSEATTVLKDVLEALAALQGRVVHRDLKPENILRLNSRWCLADFGIARYAEETTAPDTRKFAMTPRYAAPEQWRSERATSATDIYALGVIGYEMLSGVPPFGGPNIEHFREQHLREAALPLDDVPANLAGIVAQCLVKAPGARPTAASLLDRLHRTTGPVSPAAERLQRANLQAVQRTAEEAATVEAQRTDAERRRALYEAAESLLGPIHDALRAQLLDNVPAAAPKSGAEWPFELNEAGLMWVPIEDSSGAEWRQYRPAFEVIAHAGLELRVPETNPYLDYHGRSHSLWYCNAQRAGEFRWYETAFASEFRSAALQPQMLAPGHSAGKALSPVVLPEEANKIFIDVGGPWQLSRPFVPIDGNETDAFIERWLAWLADAVSGELRPPDRLPEQDPSGSYRT